MRDMNSKTSHTKKRTFAISDNIFSILLILPTLIVLGIVIALPMLKGIYVSFADYKIGNLNDPVWNNFENYISLFRDGKILLYFTNTIVFVALVVSVQFVAGLAVAMLLNTRIRWRGGIRALLLIPWTIPSVVVAILWRWLVHEQYGSLNYLLYKIGITDTINVSWLLNPNLALAVIVLAVVWKQLPYMMVMLLAGLHSVDQSLIEASKIDGASWYNTLLSVTIPAMRPVIMTSIWIAVMANFQMYTIISNITGGGPNDATATLSIAAYKTAFRSFDFGTGAAIGVIWLLILAFATLINNKISEKYNNDY